MSWEWLDLVTGYLNPDALIGCKDSITAMSPWLQGILVGAVFLLAGGAVLELFFGLKMQRFARCMAGLSVGFAVCFVILCGYTQTEPVRMVLYSLLAGVAAGLLYAFLERGYRFAQGFLFGCALASWLVPEILKMSPDDNPGRILRLVIAAAAGCVCALLAKRLRPVLSALLGGTILGLLAEALIPYETIPFLSENLHLSEGMYRNLLPLVLAGLGLLAQVPQWVNLIREEKEKAALQAAAELSQASSAGEGEGSEDRKNSGDGEDEKSRTRGEKENTETENGQMPSGLSVAQAEAVLVEKARELALAAARNVEEIRLRERYEDVAEGLYSAEAAAGRLGVSVDQFLEGMKQSGYALPEATRQSDEEPESADTKEQPGEEPESADTKEQPEAAEKTEGETDGLVREEGPDLPQEGQTDLGEDQGSSE